MTTVATKRPSTQRADELLSDGFGPIPVLVALCLADAHDGSGPGSSIGWGLLALLLLGVIPYLVTYRVRHPRVGSPRGRSKGLYTVVVAVIAAVGFAILDVIGAPGSVLATAAAVVATLIVCAVVTGARHWSTHAAAGGAGTAMSVVLDGPWWLWLTVMLAVVGVARVRLGRHTWPQVACGAVTGAVVSTAVLWPLLN